MIVGHVVRRLVRGLAVGIVRRWFTSLLVVGLLVGVAYGVASQGLLSAPGGGGATTASGTDVREMLVEDIRTVRNSDQINLVLKEKSGNRRLVMAVGPSEAQAIFADVSAMQSRARPKVDSPTSYDLMRSLVHELGGNVSRVVVNNVTNETFYAKVIMNADSRQIEVNSRPSDAIALALRARVPIFAETSVLDKAGVSGS